MTTAFGGKPPDIPGGTPCKRTVAELIKEASETLRNRNDYSARNTAYILIHGRNFRISANVMATLNIVIPAGTIFLRN